MSETSEHLIVRFRGICGHIDLPSENGRKNGPKKKRTVLVRHTNGKGNGKKNSKGNVEPHIPYIEFFADDVEALSDTLDVTQFSRPGVEGRFARITFDEPTEVRFKDIPAGLVDEDLGYQKNVPHIGEILRSEVAVLEELLMPEIKDVKGDSIAAVFDMPEGRLVAGEPEPALTRFDPKVGFKERRLARWSDLHLAYEPPLILELAPLGGDGDVQEITFKNSLRMLTIGNEPERLILGIFGPPSGHPNGSDTDHDHNGHDHGDGSTPVQRTGHYILYYDLLKNPPADPPVPIPPQFDGSGCPNNNYP
ncbi:MAG TPA: hypothetical protein VFO89_05405 [Thermoanaerobaculia bacterium]|nr:hypothetical protein [Thermoanaerobaculia bacterium]